MTTSIKGLNLLYFSIGMALILYFFNSFFGMLMASVMPFGFIILIIPVCMAIISLIRSIKVKNWVGAILSVALVVFLLMFVFPQYGFSGNIFQLI
jgi:hypothetical protein